MFSSDTFKINFISVNSVRVACKSSCSSTKWTFLKKKSFQYLSFYSLTIIETEGFFFFYLKVTIVKESFPEGHEAFDANRYHYVQILLFAPHVLWQILFQAYPSISNLKLYNLSFWMYKSLLCMIFLFQFRKQLNHQLMFVVYINLCCGVNGLLYMCSWHSLFNPTALRKAKIASNFGLSGWNRVKGYLDKAGMCVIWWVLPHFQTASICIWLNKQ